MPVLILIISKIFKFKSECDWLKTKNISSQKDEIHLPFLVSGSEIVGKDISDQLDKFSCRLLYPCVECIWSNSHLQRETKSGQNSKYYFHRYLVRILILGDFFESRGYWQRYDFVSYYRRSFMVALWKLPASNRNIFDRTRF